MKLDLALRNDGTSAWLGLLPVALILSACGGGGGGDQTGSSISPILQTGMQRQYVGTATRSIVYTSPTTTTPNNSLSYSFTESQSVQAAPGNVNAQFDVHSEYGYTITQDPGVGSVPISQTVDTYVNLLFSGVAQTTATVAQNTVTASDDESSDAEGGGPYTQTTTTDATFPNPRYSFSYPLQTGATMNVSQASSQNITYSDVNSGGGAPPDGSNVGYTKSRTENEDGSFSFTSAYVNSNSLDETQSADGSGQTTFANAINTITTNLGLPTTSAGTASLPVTRTTVTTSSGISAVKNYSAADWYPSNGQPDSPLVLQAENVVGPASSLPAQCSGAIERPNIYEIDTTTTNLSTMNATYSVTMTRSFNADGVVVCSLSQETSYAYDLLTGDLTSTTTTDTQTLLNAINY